jgi:sugar lactone lactonase YvrE
MALLAFAVAGRTEDGGLRQAFERARYALQDSGHGSYRGANPAQRLTLEFDGREARLSHPDGSVSLHLSGYGYGERLRAPAPAALTGAGNRVEYRRGDLTEWYVNGSQGLEQGFTLARRPDTGGEGQPLVIALGVSGGLRPAQEADRAVLFGAALRYAGLKAVDARWRAMPSRLEARDGEIRLIVEDRDAQYPLVVDPTWTQQEELTASDGVANDLFGYSVSLSGDTALIGAYQKSGSRGAAYLFGRSGGVWSWEAEFMASDGVAGDQFGYFVSVSGETAVIGAPGTSGGQGAAYVFVRSAGAWGLQQELTASDGAAGDGFGSSVSVAGDTAVIGAYGRNSGQGAAYVFVRSGTSWSQQQELAASDGAAGDRLGCSASLSGYTAAIGACGKTANQGAVYVFVASGGVWSQQQKLTASDGATDYYFGNSVSVSGDTAVAGALNTSNGTGAAYVFVRSGGVWSQQQELTPPAGSSSYDFGNSVSVSGDTAIIGDWGGNGYRGVAYVFGRSGGVWSQQQRLTASDGAIDELGYSVSMSGDTVLIGAANGNSGRGAAYVFAFPRLGTSSLLVGSAAGASSVVLSYDGLWTATSNSSFLHIASGSASGGASGVVAFTYDAFAGTGWRTGTLTIAGLTLTVTQAGANYIGPGPLVTLVSSGLNQPMGVAVDGAGNVYIADYFNNAVKEWTAATQQISTLVAHGAPGYLSLPRGLAVDGAGNVYILNYDNYTVTEWSAATQQVTTLGFGGLYEPSGAAVDLFGNVYVTDDGHNKIEEWTFATQQVSTLVSSGLSFPEGVAVDASGNVYIADYSNGAIKEWSPVTQQVATLVSSGLSNPVGVAVDGSGNVYIADTYVQAIDEWNAATGQMSLLASSGLNLPYSVAVDVAGNVYIADTFNNAIKEIPNAFVGPASFIEPPLAGSDSLLPVIPATTNLTGVFAPTSDQSWLTIGPVANGIVGFSFTANPAAAARTAHINVLGHQIPVTQSAAGAATLSMGIGMGLGVAGAPDPAALQTDVSFDTTKLTFASASAGAALTSANKTLSAGVLPNGDVRLQTVGVDQTPISGGAVAKVTFIFNPAFTSGSASMTLKNCGASDTQGDGFTTTCATLAISGFTCDLNGDESVSVADVQIIINEALGVIPAVHDLNHDGLVNVVDVQKEINAALGLGCTY